MKRSTLLLLLFIISSLVTVQAQEIVNGGFELLNNKNLPRTWIIDNGESSFNIGIDSTVFFQGKHSLRIDGTKSKTTKKRPALAANTFGGASSQQLKSVELTAWIKTASTKDSTIALFIQDLKGDTIIRSFLKLGNPANNKWQKVTLRFKFEQPARWYGFYYGIEVNDSAVVWCDDVSLKVDQTPVKDLQNLYKEPSATDIRWLNKYLYPISSFTADDHIPELAPVGNMLSEARIVGIGEPTHGTSEATNLKLKLFKYLVEQKGFTTIALEENVPTCIEMNKIINQSEVNIRESLLSMPFYKCWKTTEMEALFEWLRAYNLEHSNKVKLIGIDMEDIQIKGARKMLRDYGTEKNQKIATLIKLVDADLDSLLVLNSKRSNPNKIQLAANSVASDLKRMQQLLGDSEIQINDTDILFDLNTAVRVCQQWLESRFFDGKRDLFMAENISYYLNSHPSEKIMVWAHNFHIANSSQGVEKVMGAYLKENYKEGYCPLAISTGAGTYMATPDYSQKLWKTYVLELPYRGTYAYVLNKAKVDNYFLPLTKNKTNGTGGKWTLEPMKHLDLGYIYSANEDNYKYYGALSSTFDGIFFFKNTTAAHTLINK